MVSDTVLIPRWLHERLNLLGLIPNEVRGHHVGQSNYSQKLIQPWAIWKEYDLNGWDADIVKRVLRTKAGEPRKLDYEKIIHVCQERIRQLECEEQTVHDNQGAPVEVRTMHSEKGQPMIEQDEILPYGVRPDRDLS